MPHGMILGQTLSGKTTLAKKMSQKIKEAGYGVLVLNDWLDRSWPCDFITTELDDYLEVVKGSEDCFLFIDEAGTKAGNFDKEAHWLATQSRHLGHSAYFIGQMEKMIALNIRSQCSNLYLFKINPYSAKELHKEWISNEILTAPELAAGEYLKISRFGPVKKYKLF